MIGEIFGMLSAPAGCRCGKALGAGELVRLRPTSRVGGVYAVQCGPCAAAELLPPPRRSPSVQMAAVTGSEP